MKQTNCTIEFENQTDGEDCVEGPVEVCSEVEVESCEDLCDSNPVTRVSLPEKQCIDVNVTECTDVPKQECTEVETEDQKPEEECGIVMKKGNISNINGHSL